MDLILSNYTFNYSMQTRWKDMDSFRHVNNATFLTYIEDARISIFNRWNIQDKKQSIIVASITISYHKQLKHPSHIIIGQKISKIGKTSFDISFGIFLDCDVNYPVATGIVTCVCFDFDKQKKQPVYDLIKNDFNK